MSNNNTHGKNLVEGLAPAIEVSQVGSVFQDTTQGLAAKIADEFRTTYGIAELDNVIITPRLAKNSVGIADVMVKFYFNTKEVQGQGEQNIFYRGKGKNQNAGGGRINMISSSGSTGSGQYGTSDKFKKIFTPICKVNDQGKAIMAIKSVPQAQNIAELEVDFNSVLCIVLGITSDDSYDFAILNWTPIPNTSNFSVMVMKYIVAGGGRKGKNSGINYARIEQESLRRFNNGGHQGNNGGGRSY